MNGNAAAILLEGLSYRYEPATPDVLHELSLEIPGGAVTAILGPNGSGKTTLLHLLLGLYKPSAGCIRLAGQLHGDYSRRELSRLVGLVPQDEHVAFDLSVLEYVLLGRAPYLNLLELPSEHDREIAFRVLDVAGLTHLQGRPVPALSGGERQLTTVARALAQEPAILLLDEPTSHLDLANKRRVLQVLRQLSHSGRSVVFSTHDPTAAAAIADHVVLLRDGRLLAAGSLADAFTSERLSATYGVDVEVISYRGRPLVVS
jgi:iron complex transport system ATP-binding protein